MAKQHNKIAIKSTKNSYHIKISKSLAHSLLMILLTAVLTSDTLVLNEKPHLDLI